jgi:hypothetical protein
MEAARRKTGIPALQQPFAQTCFPAYLRPVQAVLGCIPEQNPRKIHRNRQSVRILRHALLILPDQIFPRKHRQYIRYARNNKNFSQ